MCNTHLPSLLFAAKLKNKHVQQQKTNKPICKNKTNKNTHLDESAHFPPLLSVTSAANISISDVNFPDFLGFFNYKESTYNAELQTPKNLPSL